jgi:hypothetical protein
MKNFTSSTEIAGLIEKARSERKPDQAMVAEPILLLAPYHANLEYRAAPAPAAVHERDAEMMFVIEGTGTIITGGKLVDEKRTNAANLSGSSIAGGNTQPLEQRRLPDRAGEHPASDSSRRRRADRADDAACAASDVDPVALSNGRGFVHPQRLWPDGG